MEECHSSALQGEGPQSARKPPCAQAQGTHPLSASPQFADRAANVSYLNFDPAATRQLWADCVEKLVGFGVLKRAIALIYFGRP
jgi:hypothetical protein